MNSNRPSKKEQDELILNNMKLVHYLVHKLQVPKSDYDDMISIGTIGLIKAAKTYDVSKNAKFSTYAVRCINNELFMHYRKEKSHANDVSLDTPIANDSEGKEITLGDTIASSTDNFEKNIEERDALTNALDIILNYLLPKEKFIILSKMANLKHKHSADALKISSTYVSKIESKAKDKLKKVISTSQQYRKIFSISITDESYCVSFSKRDVGQFNKILGKLFQKLTSAEDLPDFKIKCDKEQVLVQLSACPESFYFIARIIYEIDELESVTE